MAELFVDVALRIRPLPVGVREVRAPHQRLGTHDLDHRYAGAFVYGRTRTRHRPDGSTTVATMPRSQWQFVMPGIHHGYIDWDRFEANQRQLADNARADGIQRRSGPVGEGPALLLGRVL